MRKHALWMGSCVGGGLLAGLLIGGGIRVQQDAAMPAAQPTAHAAAGTPLLEPPSGEARAIRARAESLLKEFIAESEDTAWIGDNLADAQLLVDATEDGKWVSVSTARIPCEHADRYLREQADEALGQPDCCQRWLQAATRVMKRYEITDTTPYALLAELGADRSVRVMVVYARWARDAERPDGLQLVDVRAVPVYPEAGFGRRHSRAQSDILRATRLGPYARFEN